MISTMALFVFCSCFFFSTKVHFFFQITDSTFVCSRHFKPDGIVKSLTGRIFFDFSNQHAIIINDSFEIIACQIDIL